MENHSRFLQTITVGDKVFTVTEVASQAFSYYPDETGRIVYYPSSITIPSSIKKNTKKRLPWK